MKIILSFQYIKIISLFILFLYAFIPFESSSPSKTQNIHLLFMIIIILFTLYYNNFKIQINVLARFIVFTITMITLISLIISLEKDALVFSFSIILALVISSTLYYNINFRETFISSLKLLISFSILMLFLQILILKITGEIIPIHETIYPFSESRIGIYTSFEGFYRTGGLYIEPGTYANYMYLFLFLYMLLTRKVDDLIVLLGAISIILSNSILGMIIGSYLLLFILLNKVKKATLFKKIIIICSTIIISTYFINNFINSSGYSYVISKLTTSNASADAKRIAYSKYLETFDSFLIIGQGFNPEFNIGIPSVQDAGFLLNLSVVYGILFTLLLFSFFIFLILKNYNLTFLIISLPIFISKIFYYDPIFWVVFLFLIHNIKEQPEQNHLTKI